MRKLSDAEVKALLAKFCPIGCAGIRRGILAAHAAATGGVGGIDDIYKSIFGMGL